MQRHNIDKEFIRQFNEAAQNLIQEYQNLTMVFIARIFVKQVEKNGYNFASLLYALSEIANTKGKNWNEVTRSLEEAWSAAQEAQDEED